jgi:hypothetical protein
LLIGVVSYDRAVLLSAAGMAVVTLLSTLSPTLRAFPGHEAGEIPPVAEQPVATQPSSTQPVSTQSVSTQSFSAEPDDPE